MRESDALQIGSSREALLLQARLFSALLGVTCAPLSDVELRISRSR